MKLGSVNPQGLSQCGRVACAALVFQVPMFAAAQPSSFATISAFSGAVQVIRPSGTEPAQKGSPLAEKDQIETGPGGVVQVKFNDGSSFTIYEKSALRIDHFKKVTASQGAPTESAFDVVRGKLKFFINPKAKEKAQTQFRSKTAIMGIRGTSGIIDVEPSGETQLVVLTGSVEVKNPKFPNISFAVSPNFSTRIGQDVAPQAPKPVSQETVKNLLPTVSSDAGFTEDGPAVLPGESRQDNSTQKKDPGDKKDSKEKPSSGRDETPSSKTPEKKPTGSVKPLFVPGGEVVSKSELNNRVDQSVQNTTRKGSLQSSGNQSDKTDPEKQKEKSVSEPSLAPVQSSITVNPVNVSKELERVTSAVSSTIEKTREVTQEVILNRVAPTPPPTPPPQKVKVNISLPKD